VLSADGVYFITMRTMFLYPLKFKPRFLEKMWGGRKIETVLGKPLPAGKLIGESWELYDFPPGVVDQSATWLSSEVAAGPLAGKTLHELVGQFGNELVGEVPLVGPQGQFPILIKFLDARQDLSVQVHPDRAYAAAHPEAHLKSEAWHIVQADSGARLLKGLAPGVTRQSLQAALAAGTVESLINAVPVKAGDCFYLPSGTVHALGAGILAAEVQTPSDTTFRVFDFNRIDPATGKLRTLHVEQALQCIDFSAGRAAAAPSSGLVSCEYFCIEKRRLERGSRRAIQPGRPIVWMMLDGRATVKTAGYSDSLARGDTVLLPAALKSPAVEAQSDCDWVEVTFPS